MKSSLHLSYQYKPQNDTTISLTVDMSFIPNPQNQRKIYSSQPMPLHNPTRTVSATAHTYPIHGTPPADSNMGLPRAWPQHNAAYTNMVPEVGQSDYDTGAPGMGGIPPVYPIPGTATLPNTYVPQTIKSRYTSQYDDSWNNTYDTAQPVLADQPMWERPNLGFSNYQQHSPSRSDGSVSTQVSSLSSPYTNPSPLISMDHQPEMSPYSSRYAFEPATHHQPKLVGTGAAPILSPQSHRPFATSLVSYGHPVEDAKCEFDDCDLESPSISGDPRMLTPGAHSKRGYTTPEEAVCACEICGKPFKRSNNLKTHMQTHAPDRNRPHKCEYGNCSCAFVRKTDLVRHEQSVS